MPVNATPIQVRADQRTRQQLAELAKWRKTNQSDLIRRLIRREYAKMLERQQRQPLASATEAQLDPEPASSAA